MVKILIMVSRFMVIHQQKGQWQAELRENNPLLAEFNQVQGFCEQIGRGSTQIEQPEELLAEDFVSFLFDDPNAPAPNTKVLEGMRRIFACLP